MGLGRELDQGMDATEVDTAMSKADTTNWRIPHKVKKDRPRPRSASPKKQRPRWKKIAGSARMTRPDYEAIAWLNPKTAVENTHAMDRS